MPKIEKQCSISQKRYESYNPYGLVKVNSWLKAHDGLGPCPASSPIKQQEQPHGTTRVSECCDSTTSEVCNLYGTYDALLNQVSCFKRKDEEQPLSSNP